MKKVARVPVSEVRKNFANLLDLVARGQRIKVTRYDRTLGGIVSGEDLASLAECEKAKANPPRRKRSVNEKSTRSTRGR